MDNNYFCDLVILPYSTDYSYIWHTRDCRGRREIWASRKCLLWSSNKRDQSRTKCCIWTSALLLEFCLSCLNFRQSCYYYSMAVEASSWSLDLYLHYVLFSTCMELYTMNLYSDYIMKFTIHAHPIIQYVSVITYYWFYLSV